MKTYTKPTTIILTVNTETLLDATSLTVDRTQQLDGTTNRFLGRRHGAWDDDDDSLD